MLSRVLRRFTVRQVLRVVVVGGSVVYHRKRLRRKGERRAYNGALLRVGENVLSRNAMQEKNARRFESVFCDTFIGLHQDGRNAFAHIRKQEYRYPGQQQRQQRVGNTSSSNSSFLIVSSLFIFLGFIFYLLFMLNNHRACGSDLQARRGRPTASKKKSSLKDIAFDFLHRTLVLSGFKPKKN